jgi:flagellar hook-associated protein 2
VAASVATGAVAGQSDVVVTALARAQVTVSASSAPDAGTTIVASGGTLTIGGVDVAVTGDVTLQQLASAINGTDGIGVTATVIKTADATYRLALASRETGAAHAFTIANALTGGAGLTFTDTDLDNVSGDSPEDNAVQASDASLLLNNVPVTGGTNVFQDIVAGVTLTVSKADPTATVRVDVATDGTALENKVSTFVSAYNTLAQFRTAPARSRGWPRSASGSPGPAS